MDNSIGDLSPSIKEEEKKDSPKKKDKKEEKKGENEKAIVKVPRFQDFDLVDSLKLVRSDEEDTERVEEEKQIKRVDLSIEDQIKYSCLAGKSWAEFCHTFTCSIWLKIFAEGKHVSCEGCGSTFWKKCIMDSLDTSKKNHDLQKCPICRKDATPDQFKFNVMVDKVLQTINQGFNSFQGFDVWVEHEQKAFGFWKTCHTVCCQNCQFKNSKHYCHEIVDLNDKFKSYESHRSAIVDLIDKAMDKLQKEIDCGSNVYQKSSSISIRLWKAIQERINEFIDNKLEELKARFEETYDYTLESCRNIVYELKQKRNELPVKNWPRDVTNWNINLSNFEYLESQKTPFAYLKDNMTEKNYFWDPYIPISDEICFDLQTILAKKEETVEKEYGCLKQKYLEDTKQIQISIIYKKKQESNSFLSTTKKYQAIVELPQLSQTYLRKFVKSEELEEEKEKNLVNIGYKSIKSQTKGKDWDSLVVSVKLFRYHLNDEKNIRKELSKFIKSIDF